MNPVQGKQILENWLVQEIRVKVTNYVRLRGGKRLWFELLGGVKNKLRGLRNQDFTVQWNHVNPVTNRPQKSGQINRVAI